MGMKVNGSTGLTFPDSTTMVTGSQAVKAWVNFNGTGTVAIRASYNVTSITDNGTGDYTVNFTTALADANYSTVGTATRTTYNAANNPGGLGMRTQPTTTSFRICTSNGAGTNEDTVEASLAIFR